MRKRWTIAALAALGLALASLPFIPALRDEVGSGPVASKSTACDARAKAANLDFVLKDMNGADVKLADYKGKVILLNFWATWCGPCKVEIPYFVELQDKYREEGVVFLGLSVDDPVEKLKPFAEQLKMNYPVLVGDGREDVQDAYGPIWGIPVTVMIGRDGNICKRHTGLTDADPERARDQIEQEIRALL